MAQVTLSSLMFAWMLSLAGAKMPVMFEVSEGRGPFASTKQFGPFSLHQINDSFLE